MEKKKKLVRGVNDLASVNPALAAELSDDLNKQRDYCPRCYTGFY